MNLLETAFLVFWASSLSWAMAQPASPTIRAGAYHCEGKESDGTPYTMEVRVELRDGLVFLSWWEGDLRTYAGMGFADGDRLVAVFTDGKRLGVVSYRVTGSTLDGRWTMGGGIATEVCTVPGGSRAEGP